MKGVQNIGPAVVSLSGRLAAKVLGQGVWQLRYLGRASGS